MLPHLHDYHPFKWNGKQTSGVRRKVVEAFFASNFLLRFSFLSSLLNVMKINFCCYLINNFVGLLFRAALHFTCNVKPLTCVTAYILTLTYSSLMESLLRRKQCVSKRKLLLNDFYSFSSFQVTFFKPFSSLYFFFL